jgi:hypothetical protein
MWGQRNSKYTAAVGTQLLAKIHCLESQLRDVSRLQNHPVDKLQEQTNLVGDAVDRVGRVVDTGGKGWCPDPVHHKYIARKWTKNLANTHPEYFKDIQNFPS